MGGGSYTDSDVPPNSFISRLHYKDCTQEHLGAMNFPKLYHFCDCKSFSFQRVQKALGASNISAKENFFVY